MKVARLGSGRADIEAVGDGTARGQAEGGDGDESQAPELASAHARRLRLDALPGPPSTATAQF